MPPLFDITGNKLSNKNIDQIKILVLDFDLTITDIHTKGRICKENTYWYCQENLNQLVKTLTKFKNIGWKIFIVSRGICQDIKNYLVRLNISYLFDEIYGATDLSHLSHGTYKWSEYKKQYLNLIVYENKTNKESVYFIDDTEENIQCAKSNGYSNSFVLPNIGVNSLTLVSMLEKIFLDCN